MEDGVLESTLERLLSLPETQLQKVLLCAFCDIAPIGRALRPVHVICVVVLVFLITVMFLCRGRSSGERLLSLEAQLQKILLREAHI